MLSFSTTHELEAPVEEAAAAAAGLAKLDKEPVAIEAAVLDEVTPNAGNDGVVLIEVEAPVAEVAVTALEDGLDDEPANKPVADVAEPLLLAELVVNENDGADVDAFEKEKLGAEEAGAVVNELELEDPRNENPGKDEAVADATDGEAPNVVPEEDDDPNEAEANGKLPVVAVVELDTEAEEAPKILLAPKAGVEPNKLVVVVVVPLELEVDPNKLDPPNRDAAAGADVPNPKVEPVEEAEEAPKPRAGDAAADDCVEDEDDANENPKEEAEDADDDDDAGAPNVGLEGADAPNREEDDVGLDVDDDGANENGDGEDDDAGFVLKEKPAIVDASLSVDSG
ncbi:hypothetical protein E3N88_16894 [Mikania micrantha]|uniref:Uncharacterized protein n=1 Tax=Mikania micrantha TaxID=192012 RepID=A0A5N6NSY2_9ASTR|nr:hypothetical protein E3N88_16894 [Mikania micrantha]